MITLLDNDLQAIGGGIGGSYIDPFLFDSPTSTTDISEARRMSGRNWCAIEQFELARDGFNRSVAMEYWLDCIRCMPHDIKDDERRRVSGGITYFKVW